MRGWQIVPRARQVPFESDILDATNVKDGIEEAYQKALTALNTPIYNISSLMNGIVSNNTWYGYTNLLPGDATPIIVAVDSIFVGFTWSNPNAGADYTLEFRKNATTNPIFLSVSKVNTPDFVYDLVTPEVFDKGDKIFIQHIDDGGNAQDVALILNFRATAP